MIRRGHLPSYRSHINKDSVVLLKYFVSGREEPSLQDLQRVCHTLHLAFQGQSYGEVYNILAGMVLKAIHNYDPHYTVKVRQIVAAIARDIDVSGDQVFTAKDLAMSFDAEKPLRWLAKKGILETVKEPGVKNSKIIGFRVATWPPSKSIINVWPIGLAYHIQRQFRFYLQDYISDHMREIEARHLGGMQLEHRGGYAAAAGQRVGIRSHNGCNLSPESRRADLSMNELQLDVGKMNMKWVSRTRDPLFASLTSFQRRILYFYFAREMSWKQIARTCRKGIKTIHRVYRETIDQLQAKAAVPLAA